MCVLLTNVRSVLQHVRTTGSSKLYSFTQTCKISTIRFYSLAGMIIREHADGYASTVRGGPMDVDTRNFGLRFGPNMLQIFGNYMRVRLANVTAKRMHFEVEHGSIIGTDVATSDPNKFSVFKTTGADIILTTTAMTTVKMKQDSGNLVCLTAANNSLFVDDRRQMQVTAIASRQSDATYITHTHTHTHTQHTHTHTRRSRCDVAHTACGVVHQRRDAMYQTSHAVSVLWCLMRHITHRTSHTTHHTSHITYGVCS
jgi:hypothetical protein